MKFTELLYEIVLADNFIIGVIGDLGGGKTLSATSLSIILNYLFKDKDILTNTPLNKITHELIEQSNQLDERKNKIILMDEVQLYADCRKSTSHSNFFTSAITTDIRKRDNFLIWTAPDAGLVDLRIRKRTLLFLKPNKLNDRLLIELYVSDIRNNIYDSVILNLYPFRDYYDTNYKPIPFSV